MNVKILDKNPIYVCNSILYTLSVDNILCEYWITQWFTRFRKIYGEETIAEIDYVLPLDEENPCQTIDRIKKLSILQ